MKIRLHSWNAKCNHKISESDITCSIRRIEEDITKRKMVYRERNNTLKNWTKTKRSGRKQLQYTRIIKKIGKNQNNKKEQKEKIYKKGRVITMGKSIELTETNREKYKINKIMMVKAQRKNTKRRTMKRVKENRSSIYKKRRTEKDQKRERIETRSRVSKNFFM